MKPARRTLGLSIAIICVVLLYSVMPLMEVYFLRRLAITANEAYLGGVDITIWNWLSAGLGVITLVICIAAWFGRPAWIRFALPAIVLVPTVIHLYRAVDAMTTSIDPITGGQTQEVIQGWLTCQTPALIIVPIYVLWYLNRAPARAFFRRVPLEPREKE